MGALDSIRQRLPSTGISAVDRALGDLARDVSNAIGALLGFRLVEFTGLYTEPMYVGADREPKACLLVRVRAEAALETPVRCGAAVHYVWEERNRRLRVTSVDGLTPDNTSYRFTFLLVGA